MHYRRHFNHATDSEYEELRNRAQDLNNKHSHLSRLSQNAFESGDEELGLGIYEQAEQVLEQAQDMNHKAAEYVFRMNNSDLAPNTVDLHGLYVKEVEIVLKKRLAEVVNANQSYLRVIVGKGLHSANGMSRLGPAVEDICDDNYLSCRISRKNAGVLIIDLSDVEESEIPSDWDNSSITESQQAYHHSSTPQYQQGQQGGNQQHQREQDHSGGIGNASTGNKLVNLLVRVLCICFKSR